MTRTLQGKQRLQPLVRISFLNWFPKLRPVVGYFFSYTSVIRPSHFVPNLVLDALRKTGGLSIRAADKNLIRKSCAGSPLVFRI